uniref:Uncharacterized protein n=1 Tax=Steinernema glaseri TaxID=37863 RepID=A0A1I7Y3G3_9BILA
MQHPAADAERAAQQTLGHCKVGTRQCFAHLRAADPQALELHGLRRFHGEAVAQAGLLQEREVTHPVAAEPEVVTDLQVLHAQAVDQDGVDEFGGAELAQALVERQAQHPVDAFGGQQGDLVWQHSPDARGEGCEGLEPAA